ncbi:MAG: hypothetical protein MI867_00800, partial [Pseudomonadales bacterium]|nr:hypothetical protein [Pseudomonadales bacterium]
MKNMRGYTTLSAFPMSIRIPFEAKLLLLTCLALVLLGCGSGETSSSSDDTTLSLEEANLSEYPIVYVKRAIAEETRELTDLDGMTPGAELYVRGTASSESPEVNLTQRIFGTGVQYDVKDINISYDGNYMVFSARGPFDDTVEEDEEQPTQWNLYEYSFASGEVYAIMNSSEAARGHDITPHYLADGRLVFSSSRQARAGTIMLDEGKPQYTYQVEDQSDERGGPAFALHLAEFDSNRNLSLVEQTTFNMSHDFDPVLMENGKVVFTRWDNVRGGGRDQISFYQMNPDGAGLELLYGYDSHETDDEDIEVQYSNPQASPDGQLISLLRTFDGEGYEPNIVKIDIANFVDINTPIGDASGSAESPVTKFETTTDPEEISAGGRFSYIMPLEDGTNRAIVSWSFCRLQNTDGTVASCSGVDLSQEDLVEAPPNYGLWLFDFDEDTQIPLVLGEGNTQAFFDIAFAIPRTPPASIPDVSPVLAEDSTNPCSPGFFEQDDGYGMVHIRSVYDWDGAFYSNWVTNAGVTNIAQLSDPVAVTADERSARFIRFDKPVYIPDEDLKEIPGNVTAQGAFASFMREILGFAPIQPDGSVKVKVPADVPFIMTVVDQYGRRLSDSNEHRNWLQVRPGEVMECSGCHDPSSDEPHGRREARPTSINSGASAGVDFPNTNPEVYNVDVDGEIDPRDCAPGSGETMAEVYVRTDASRANISPDLVFDDVWTDPAQRTPDTSFAHRYSDIEAVYEAGETNGDEDTGVLPYNRGACADEWD